jgi:hypothetical protein
MKKNSRTILILIAILAAAEVLSAQSAQENVTVIVSTDLQKTYVYRNNDLIRTMVCSTGLHDGDSDTPYGDYVINSSGTKRGEWFFSKTYAEGAKYWVGFIGGVYLFHSVAMDEKQNIIPAEAAKLGQPASHGCIRLSVEDAHWFYRTIPDGADVHIVKNFKEEQNLGSCSNYKGVPIPKEDMFVWLSANGKDYKQKYLLSCEAALIRTAAALSGITHTSEDDILAALPRSGTDPEKYFVCDNINAGRKNKDGSVHWNNYGTHPPVVIHELQQLFTNNGKSDRLSATEEKLTDSQLAALISSSPAFRGAIVWVVGHPERWGADPQVNERGMVLGEHVRFVLPVKDAGGNFLIYDPENGRVSSSKSAGASRDLFKYRTVCINEK